jgi:hypothetical protein
MPSISISRAPRIALVVALPPDGRTKRSAVPVGDVAVAVLGRLPHEEAHDSERRLALPAVARVGHDRGQRAHDLRVLSGQRLGDHAAHRDADDVHGSQLERADQPGGIAGHVGQPVVDRLDPAQHELAQGRGPPRYVGRAARVAVVEAHDEEPRAASCSQNSSGQPIICMPSPWMSSRGRFAGLPNVS